MVVAIIEVVSKVERDIRGGDLDSNMSHPSFPMFWKCFHQEKYVQYGSSSAQSQSWKSLSGEPDHNTLL